MQRTEPLLSRLAQRRYLTDGGLETTLVFHDGIALPDFAAFALLRQPGGAAILSAYFERYIAIAKAGGYGFVLESPTWRASADWGARLGYSRDEIAAINRDSIRQLLELKARHAGPALPMIVSGCVGPRGDGYVAGALMTAAEAEAYHAHQIGAFAEAGAEMTAAITMTNVPEAIGFARAAAASGLPAAVSFTLETDGRLPSGQNLSEAIAEVDAATGKSPAYYMINCAHPDHFAGALPAGAAWTRRVRGLRANASRRSHQELNDSPDLDAGDPVELGGQYRAILRAHPQIAVLGGCCGTDHRHLECIGHACRESLAA